MEIQVIKPRSEQKDKKLRVCAYARVSTGADEQENSLENQMATYEDLIKANPAYEFVGLYHDFGISGFKERRPGYQKMMHDCRAGKIDLIITKSVSRFARNTVTLLKSVRELKSLGVGIYFELQNINTLSSEGEVMLTIIAAFAQAEVEDGSANAKMTYKRKFEAGIPAARIEEVFGFAPGNKGEITIDKEAAKVIRLMFDLAEQGIWPSRIATYLNKKGYKTATGVEWNTAGVFRVLKREYYIGDVLMQRTYLDAERVRHKNNGEVDRYYIKNNHPAIVTRKQWNKVQEILQERSEYLAADRPERKMGGDSHNTYELSGLLYCPHCGKMLHHRVYNKGKNISWCCGTRIKKGVKSCKGVSVLEKIAEEQDITEPTTVIKKKDKYGQDTYSFIPKAEFEASGACKYELKKSNKLYSHSTYPLSGKLYCGKCGSLMHHNWSWKHEEFWWCGARVKQGPEACEGIKIPGAIADSWNIDSEVIVYEEVDENGETSYSYKSK